MQVYLSSYNLGDHKEELRKIIPQNNKLGYIGNALDASFVDLQRKKKRMHDNMDELNQIGFDCIEIDLKDYFGAPEKLEKLVESLGGVFVCGGNVFVLRQAIMLSGFDALLLKLNKKKDFFYGGYSAGVCILGPTLDGYHIVDDATETPYQECNEVLWDGLGIVDFVFLPHYQSDHKESGDIEKALQYCKDNDIPYKTAKDGDVLIFET